MEPAVRLSYSKGALLVGELEALGIDRVPRTVGRSCRLPCSSMPVSSSSWVVLCVSPFGGAVVSLRVGARR